MLVVADVDEVFVPISEGLFVQPSAARYVTKFAILTKTLTNM